MSKNADSLPGRYRAADPLVREAFGPAMTLYADSNSSYDVPKAIGIGRLMEEYNYDFFEEPCRFDHLEDTKAVADALSDPGGRGRAGVQRGWVPLDDRQSRLDIVQPDLHYHGGFIRSMRVARMAHAAGMLCTPHMSGSGLGYLDAAHFASCIPNPARSPSSREIPTCRSSSDTSSLKVENGMVRVPTGPGFGITVDPAFVRACQRVEVI